MSTDLDQLTNDLPKINLSAIRVQCEEATKDPTSISSNDRDHELECRTPTADENKIPTILTCPPAPKKRTISSKRKLFGELNFFEIVNRDEVDAFFRSSFELVGNSAVIVKRCKCI